MGVISRKIFPACGNMCICCPALRSRSRQPVKRYKKLLADIFPKSLDGPQSERKIIKLCEYAAKNPFRIPKIVKYLEDRCCKELRNEQVKCITIIADAYNKLLSLCKNQMAYFAGSLLKVIVELLDNAKHDDLRILGCQTLTNFIHNQADSTYMHNVENLVPKVCMLALERGDDHKKQCLRASSLQCISAMVWFMTEYSHIFPDFDEMVRVSLENYDPARDGNSGDSSEPHHNWLNEVVRSEGRCGTVGGDASGSCTIIRPRPEKKDPALLTREEVEAPRVWSQICLQRMVDLAKESTTMRRVLDPMLVYFDSGRHWVPQQGLALMVLSDILYFMESSGDQHLVLASVIRHLDHKNISHDPQLKSCVIQVASNLARQIRSGAVLADIGSVSDLCRHLRKSLQVTVDSVGQQELDLNISLQNSIEDCLLEIAKGIGDARPLYDLMAIFLENLTSGVVARATIGSLMVLAHMISLAPISSDSQQAFPEALLVQILKAMLHPDIETRIGAHQMFSVLVFPSSNSHEHGTSIMQSSSPYKPTAWHSNAASTSTSASITALLDKLRREKDGSKEEKTEHVHDNLKLEEDWKQRRYHRNYPTFHKIQSIIDRKAKFSSSTEEELRIMKFSEDQLSQLLSAFWIQANLPDNLPSNIEAIANSFVLTLISARLKSQQDNLTVRFFQLPLSLRNVSLEPNHGTLSPSSQRSVFILSMGMLLFAAKLYHIPHLNHLVKSLVACDADPYLVIGEDLHIYLKSQADLREYGSVTDNELAQSFLSDLRNKVYEADNVIMDILAQNLSVITELDKSELAKLIFEAFTPDDPFLYGPRSMLDFRKNQSVTHSKESLSFDGDLSNFLVEDEVTSEASVADIARFIPRVPPSPSVSHIMGIGQLLESALEVAGQVVGTSVSTSPLPYNAMASQCEALGTGTRKKLSNWLAHENQHTRAADGYCPSFPVSGHSAVEKIMADGRQLQGVGLQADRWMGMRLPPASPFDNFLKAAGC
ncbi:protein SEMI-ROLLED LEAF 2 [Cucumis melo]|uniref:Protein SEMI-ROLLED LEAF 2 n=1 Tax=Cucumis melo TaxID=3656 RepID=A0A1S3BWX0_CUCME|nr:protein SEMI-ROLLED LEAF 2 [Cucumis melo]